MKKILVMLILSLGIMGVLAGCEKKKDVEDDNEKLTPTPEVTSEEDSKENESDGVGVDTQGEDTATFVPLENPVIKEEYDYNEYIKLGKYKGIEVKVDIPEIAEEDIDAYIQMDLNNNGVAATNVTDRTVRFADTVSIDFVGYHNGEPFDGGSAEGYDLTIGSKAFIDGFEEQLIGAELGKEIDVNVVFPDNYGNATLAGEPAVFKVKVNDIKHFEITEEFLNATMGFDNKEAYRESIRQAMIAYNTDIATRQQENDVYTAVIKEAKITLPDNLVEYYESERKTLYNNIAASYQTTLENFLLLSNSSLEEYEADVKDYSNYMATRELIIKAISTAEGITVTKEEVDDKIAGYVEQYGYESKEQFLEEADENMIREDLLFYKVINFLVEESIEI